MPVSLAVREDAIGSSCEFAFFEYDTASGKRACQKVRKSLIARFGGWFIGTSPVCNLVLDGDGVNNEHVVVTLEGPTRVRLQHLRSGRQDSVMFQGKWVPVGESMVADLPVSFQVGVVKLEMHD